MEEKKTFPQLIIILKKKKKRIKTKKSINGQMGKY